MIAFLIFNYMIIIHNQLKNNMNEIKKLTLIGIKPTNIHLGHLLSVFHYAHKNTNIVFLVADYHKFSSVTK